MSTRSTIGIINKDGSVESIYCHWDGYPSYNGVLLKKYYSDEEKLRKLLALGDISFLGVEPTSNSKLWDLGVQCDTTPEGFNTVCLAYKDRGDDNVDSKEFNSEKEFLDYYTSDCDFNYLYDTRNNTWYCMSYGRSGSRKELINYITEYVDKDLLITLL